MRNFLITILFLCSTIASSVVHVGTAWSQSGSGSAAAQAITGDSETAPDHIVVNTFVKIN